MNFLLPALLPLLIGAAGAAVAIAGFRNSRKRNLARVFIVSTDAVSVGLMRHVRIRVGIALGVAAVVAGGIAVSPIDQLSSSLMFAPGLGAAAGLVTIAIAPLGARPKGAVVRQADLTPRQASSFGPKWGFIFPLIAASALALMVVLIAMTASVDSQGRSRMITVLSATGSNSAGPYPGWFYAGPLLVVTVILCAITLLSVYRISSVPSRNISSAFVVEQQARRSLTEFSLLFSTAVIVFYLGAITMVAGSATRSASEWSTLKPGYSATADPSQGPYSGDFIHGVIQPQFAVASAGTLIGVLLITGAATLLFLAARIMGRRAGKSTLSSDDKNAVSA